MGLRDSFYTKALGSRTSISEAESECVRETGEVDSRNSIRSEIGGGLKGKDGWLRVMDERNK